MLHLHGLDPGKPGTTVYIITGDSGQGMTGATIGAMVVSDLILGKPEAQACFILTVFLSQMLSVLGALFVSLGS